MILKVKALIIGIVDFYYFSGSPHSHWVTINFSMFGMILLYSLVQLLKIKKHLILIPTHNI